MCCRLASSFTIRSCWCNCVSSTSQLVETEVTYKFAWKIRGRKSCEQHTLLLLIRDKYWIIFKKVFVILELFVSNNFISKRNFPDLKNIIINYYWILNLFKRFLNIILIRFLINFQLTFYFRVKSDPCRFEHDSNQISSSICEEKKKIK